MFLDDLDTEFHLYWFYSYQEKYDCIIRMPGDLSMENSFNAIGILPVTDDCENRSTEMYARSIENVNSSQTMFILTTLDSFHNAFIFNPSCSPFTVPPGVSMMKQEHDLILIIQEDFRDLFATVSIVHNSEGVCGEGASPLLHSQKDRDAMVQVFTVRSLCGVAKISYQRRILLQWAPYLLDKPGGCHVNSGLRYHYSVRVWKISIRTTIPLFATLTVTYDKQRYKEVHAERLEESVKGTMAYLFFNVIYCNIIKLKMYLWSFDRYRFVDLPIYLNIRSGNFHIHDTKTSELNCKEAHSNIASINEVLICDYTIDFMYKERSNKYFYIGEYNATLDHYVINDQGTKYQYVFMSSYNITGIEASQICAHRGHQWSLMSLPSSDFFAKSLMEWLYKATLQASVNFEQTLGFFFQANIDTITEVWKCSYIKRVITMAMFNWVKFCNIRECRLAHFYVDHLKDILHSQYLTLCDNDSSLQGDARSLNNVCGLYLTHGSVLVPCDVVLYNVGVICQKTNTFKIRHIYEISENSAFYLHKALTNIKTQNLRPPFVTNLMKLLHLKNFDCNIIFSTVMAHLFICRDRTYILDHHVCDGVHDCPGGKDEENCEEVCRSHNTYRLMTHLCFDSCHDLNCSCQSLYFHCKGTSQCIPKSKICDCRNDCNDGSDEQKHLCSYTTCALVQNQLNTTHHRTDIFLDRSFHTFDTSASLVCFIPPDVKIFFFHVMKYFAETYPNMRLPVHKFCDGQHDCHNGIDERYDCHKISVAPSFRCAKDHRFVNFGQLADRFVECPSSYDDELILFFNHNCQHSPCKCVGFSVLCTGMLPSLYTVSFWTFAKTLEIIQIQSNASQIFTLLQELKYILYLTLEHDELTSLHNGSFRSLQYITVIDLSHNQLASIAEGTFKHQLFLSSLDLSHNQLTQLTRAFMDSLVSITELNLSENPYLPTEFPLKFSMQSLCTLHTVHADICCLFPDTVKCIPDVTGKDIIGDCQTVLGHDVLLGFMVFYICVNLVLNGSSFLKWVIDARCGWRASHILGCNLNAADGLITLYCGILVFADIMWRHNVGHVALQWKRSGLCRIASFILSFSLDLSTVSTLLIAIDIFACFVIHPFKRRGLSIYVVVCVLPVFWMCASILPLLATVLLPPAVTNNACIILGFSLPLSYSIPYLVTSSLSFSIITMLYAVVFITVQRSRQQSCSRSANMHTFVYKLGGIILTNFVAWVTIATVTILSICNVKVYPFLETVFGLTMFPMNALINPALTLFRRHK